MTHWLDISVLDNGNLRLSVRDGMLDDAKEDFSNGYLKDHEIFEPYSCNGSYELFDAGDANPFVGLTDAPCIAESMDYLEDGTKEIIGRFWYYSDYQLSYWFEELIDNGEVIFTLAND